MLRAIEHGETLPPQNRLLPRDEVGCMTPLRRACILGVGLLTIAVGLGMDLFRSGAADGIGSFQMQICALGVVVALLALLPGALRVHYARVLLALGATYVSALAVELLVMPSAMPWGLVNASLQGMVRPARWGGFELTPGWRGRYEDGVRGADVEINALGDRDDYPSVRDVTADERVLLLGDSFAFGWGLDKQDTVEAQIERESRGRASAYNMGVGGYGPADALEHYRERASFPATHTFFLLYGNDLRVDNCAPAVHTAVGGVVVPRSREDGAAYTADEVERKLAAALEEDGTLWLQQIKRALALSQLRSRLLRVVRNDFPLATGPLEEYTPECAVAAAAFLDEMREVARARGQSFSVVVVPTPGETLQHTYFDRMQECIRELERRQIPVVEVRDALTVSDYFEHHEHLNPSGAHKVAQAILATVEEPALTQVGSPGPTPQGAAPRLSSSVRSR
jgi:hypothetical protein